MDFIIEKLDTKTMSHKTVREKFVGMEFLVQD